MFSEKNVPLFSPALPNPAVFGTDKFDVFRNFLLVKCEYGTGQVIAHRGPQTVDPLVGGISLAWGGFPCVAIAHVHVPQDAHTSYSPRVQQGSI